MARAQNDVDSNRNKVDGWMQVYRSRFRDLALEPMGPILDNKQFSGACVMAGAGVSRGGPGQWGFVNLVRAGTQQP